MGRPPHGVLPGATTYLVLAIWSAVVVAAIVAGAFAGGGASRLLPPASQGIPLAGGGVAHPAAPPGFSCQRRRPSPSPPSRSPTVPRHGSGATFSASTCGWC